MIAGCSIVAHFAAFTFIETLLSSVLTLPNTWITVCLLIFGIAGLIGNCICGIFIDNHLRKVLCVGLLLVGISLALIILPIFNSKFITLLLLSGWGLGIAIVFVGLQTWIIRVAKKDALPASAIYAAIFNGAVGFGAIFGSGILEHWSVSVLYYLASIITLISLLLLCVSSKILTIKEAEI
nr:MFS transporter [Rosenbergiella australiborealis]